MRILLLTLLVILGVPTFAAGPDLSKNVSKDDALVIRLEFEARVGGKLVRLRDVAEPVTDPQKVWPEIADLVVGHGPGRWVTRGKVLDRLLGAGVNEVELEGPGICMVAIGEVVKKEDEKTR